MKFKGLVLSIFLTVVLVACGQKKPTTLELRYGKDGLIVSHLVEDPTPITPKDGAYTPGERLLQTAWGQSAPFNSTLPLVNNEKPVVGCVNTAMAQLLYYYQYPTQSRGIVFGRLAAQDQWADLNQPIHWSLISRDHRTLSSSAEIEEFGEMFRKMALVNKTSLGTSASGGSSTLTSLMTTNLVKYYGYSNQIMSIYSTAATMSDQVISFIKTEIDEKRPLFLSLHGTLNHLVLIDGYREENGEFQVHLNMGWEGLHDNFYSLSNPIEVKETFERDGSTWQRVLSAEEFTIYGGITPCRENCFSDKEDGDHRSDNVLIGNFESMSDVDTFGPFPGASDYQLDFKSALYSNNPYYVTVINKFGQIIEEKTTPFTLSMLEDFYIRISPASAINGRYYRYLGDYSVTVKNLGAAATQATPREFKLSTSLSSFVMKPDEQEVIRLSLYPYAPENLEFKVTSAHESSETYSLDRNLLFINAAHLTSNSLNEIKVEAYLEDKKLDEISINIFVTEQKFQQGKIQVLRGKFLDASSTISFSAALQGKCTLSGDRGFSNQGFFISTQIIEASDGPIQSEFDLGIYTINASLKKGYSSYPYDEAKSTFEVLVECPDANYSFSEIIETL